MKKKEIEKIDPFWTFGTVSFICVNNTAFRYSSLIHLYTIISNIISHTQHPKISEFQQRMHAYKYKTERQVKMKTSKTE